MGCKGQTALSSNPIHMKIEEQGWWFLLFKTHIITHFDDTLSSYDNKKYVEYYIRLE